MKKSEVMKQGRFLDLSARKEYLRADSAVREVRNAESHVLRVAYEAVKHSVLRSADCQLLQRLAYCMHEWGEVPQGEQVEEVAEQVHRHLPVELAGVWGRTWRSRLKEHLHSYRWHNGKVVDFGI